MRRAGVLCPFRTLQPVDEAARAPRSCTPGGCPRRGTYESSSRPSLSFHLFPGQEPVDPVISGVTHAPAEASFHRFGGVEVDLRATEVRRDGRPVSLSAKEFKLLRYFIQHPGTPLGRHELLDQVWGADAMPTTRTVDVHVAWLRRKLEADPRRPALILTVHGLGYKFVAGGPGLGQVP
jgi:DNA-binding response OmpR family regulator